ncbi:MAG TPA: DUF5110 domain-containing protein, partial [Candidatus Angelobacter sp.]|nr:DUF5110 domain-containing protein [Candidatus Angelobacter sp.]
PPPREPWVDGPQHESIRKKYIELRYRLLPYIYTAVEETTRTGLPLMRPLFLEYPSLPPAIGGGLDEFLFGRDMLVAPKVHDGPDSYEVVLPTAGWFDYWTGQRVDGTQPLRVNPALDTIPVYVRAGAIVPQQPVIQNADEVPQGPLELRVYPGQDCSGSLYMDDGHTFAYLRGEYSRRQFTCSVTQQAVTVTIGAEEGAYTPWWKDMQIQVFGIERQPTTVSAGKEDVAGWKYDANTKTVTFSRAATRQGESISIH